MLEYIVLGMVLDNALTGYDVKKHIEAGIGMFYKASFGSLYPALQRLTNKDYLTLSEKMQGKRVKKYYKATETGRVAFNKWLSSPLENKSNLEGLLARVFFFDKLPAEIRNQQLDEYEASQQQILRKLQSIEKQAAAPENMDSHYYMLSTIYYGIELLKLNLRWCRHIREHKKLVELLENA